ncbi:MAG: hypothetical protein L0271_09035, partial [Gemmatimonadetes bacterium]|nr:hypothetical protein [Gemmatimonadota bacterium]
MNRRDFLTVAPWCAAVAATGIARAASRPRRILFLGGTGFFGPSAVQSLIDAGHDVTLANRGVTNPGLFPELRLIRCDRDTPDGSGLAALRGALRREHFDWVVDTWQGHPAAVSETARHARGRAGAYQYVSTLAVYLDWDEPGINESYPLNDTSGLSMDWSAEHRYAIRKTLAEHEVRRYFPDSSCIFRSHGMRGYQIDEPRYEPYWPVRIQRGGDVLVPGDGRHYCQITDMMSLAQFMTSAGETGVAGAYNVAYAPICFLDYLRSAERATGTRPRYHWIPAEVLAEYDVRPYRDIPLWRPMPAGSYRFDVSAAERAGLRNRPLEA